MSKTEHTPTPWGIERTRDTMWIGPMRPDGHKVASIVFYVHRGPDYIDEHNMRAEANAEFIVNAVNSHDEMLAALKDAKDTIHACDAGDPTTETGWANDDLLDVWKACDAAISRATGQAGEG